MINGDILGDNVEDTATKVAKAALGPFMPPGTVNVIPKIPAEMPSPQPPVIIIPPLEAPNSGIADDTVRLDASPQKKK